MSVTTKLKDWQHEREYRITLQSRAADLSILSERTAGNEAVEIGGL
jgi:hypothetical protein